MKLKLLFCWIAVVVLPVYLQGATKADFLLSVEQFLGVDKPTSIGTPTCDRHLEEKFLKVGGGEQIGRALMERADKQGLVTRAVYSGSSLSLFWSNADGSSKVVVEVMLVLDDEWRLKTVHTAVKESKLPKNRDDDVGPVFKEPTRERGISLP